MQRIFITGVCGFLGSNLASYFQSLGYQVYGIDNLSRKGSILPSAHFSPNKLTFASANSKTALGFSFWSLKFLWWIRGILHLHLEFTFSGGKSHVFTDFKIIRCSFTFLKF